MTDAEIADTFGKAYRNWKHELIEMSFYTGQFWVKEIGTLRRECDRLHAAIDADPETPKEPKRARRKLPHQL